jgi:hypothetical protein
MTTIAELTVQEEIGIVREVVESRGWELREVDGLHFVLGLPASDGSFFHLAVDCDDYPVKPAAWHWCDREGNGRDVVTNAPMGSEFFHSSGVICAPWNRLAYKTIDPRGPHGEWVPTDWRNNPYTKGCKTLCAMALRVAVELKGPRYHRKRLGT